MSTGEHQAAAQATAESSAPVTLADVVSALNGQAAARNRPSHPQPGQRVSTGAVAEGRYIPTLSLDPKNITSIEGVNDQTMGYVRSAFDAFTGAYNALQRLSDAREQVKKDPSKTEAAQILLLAAEAEKLQERMTKKMDLAQKALSDGVAHTEKELSTPLTAKADTTLGREVREYVKNLPNEKRHSFLENALKENDLPTLHAVLGAQPFLSGLTPQMQAHFTRALHEKSQPDLALRLNVQKRALELVAQRGPLVFKEIVKVMGADWKMVDKLRKAQSSAEQALLLINSPAQQ